MEKFVWGVILVGFLMVVLARDEALEQVMSGDNILICYIGAHEKEISPSKIVGHDDERNIWLFTNGYSRNCRIYKDVAEENER